MKGSNFLLVGGITLIFVLIVLVFWKSSSTIMTKEVLINKVLLKNSSEVLVDLSISPIENISGVRIVGHSGIRMKKFDFSVRPGASEYSFLLEDKIFDPFKLNKLEVYPIYFDGGKYVVSRYPGDFVSFGKGQARYVRDKAEKISLEDKQWAQDRSDFVKWVREKGSMDAVVEDANSNFVIEDGSDEIMQPSFEVWKTKRGDVEDIMRMLASAVQVLYLDAGLLIFDSNGNFFPVVVYQNKDFETKYVYFYNGKFGIDFAGKGYDDVVSSEEKRRNIKIDKMGLIYEGDLMRGNSLSIGGIMQWQRV